MISRCLSMLLVHDLGSNMENKKKNMKLKSFWLISIVVRHKIYATGDITDANDHNWIRELKREMWPKRERSYSILIKMNKKKTLTRSFGSKLAGACGDRVHVGALFVVSSIFMSNWRIDEGSDLTVFMCTK